MIALLDFGNSYLKVVTVEGEKFSSVVRMSKAEKKGVASLVEDILTYVGASECYVISGRGDSFDSAFEKEFFCAAGRKPIFLSVVVRKDLKLAYSDVTRFGVDRFFGLMGVQALGYERALVVDAGTAVTFDVLDRDKHVGGCIFPGKELLVEALVSGGEKINLLSSAEPELLAKGTESGVLGGTGLGYISAVSGIVEELQEEFEMSLPVVVTGGDGEIVAGALQMPTSFEPNLLFAGMHKLIRES